MKKKRNKALISNAILLAWFFLDMVGVGFGNNILVTRSYREDWMFFIIFLIVLLWFMKSDEVGKFVLPIWLLMWFSAQFFSHWYFTIFGPWEGKNKYFEETIKLIPSDILYIPDLYHIVLHLLILASLFFTVNYGICKKNR